MAEMPASTDLVWLRPAGAKVEVVCEVCHEGLGVVRYLNQAIVLWTKHQAAKRTDALPTTTQGD